MEVVLGRSGAHSRGMSTDRQTRAVRCGQCGHEGVREDWSDDWGRSGTIWHGFETMPASDHMALRKRAEDRPVCGCGSTDISDVEVV